MLSWKESDVFFHVCVFKQLKMYKEQAFNKPKTCAIAIAASLCCMVLALLFSCADSEYSRYACHLSINNATMQNMTLGSAMTEDSPGIFVRISREGTTRFKFESNQGTTTYGAITAIDQKAQWTIGIYNGVIVGFGAIDRKFMAYDNQCPNCYESSGLTRYALTMNTDATATCRYCQRVYDLNNGGILVKGDKGRGLIKYRAYTTGAFGLLQINN